MDFAADFELDDLPEIAGSNNGAFMEESRPVQRDLSEVVSGVYSDMPNETYHSQKDWLSRGGISVLNHSPTRFRYMQTSKQVSKRPLDVGSLFHDLAMFGESFVSKHYLKMPKVNKRTTAGKEELEAYRNNAASHQVLIEDEDWDLVRYMRDSVMQNDLARELLEHNATCFEHSHFYTKQVETESGIQTVKMRVRPDIKNREFSAIVDLKSIAPNLAWDDAVMSHGYDLQSVMYPDGVHESEGWMPDNFWFFVTEKTKENPVTEVFSLDDWHKERGLSQYHAGMKRFAELNKSGDWFLPSITRKPKWAKN